MNGQRDRCAVVRACWAGVHEATRVRLGNDRPLVASSVLGQPFSYHTTFVAIYIGYLLVIAVVPPGGGGKLPPVWMDVQKLCNMCVLSLSWNFFVSHDKYIARPSSKEPR